MPADISTTITIGGPGVAVTTTTPGQNARLTFSGTTGQQVSLARTAVTMGSNYVSMTNPDGSTLLWATWSSGGGTNNVTLTQTGTHTILVDPEGEHVGSMTVTLSQVGGSASPPLDEHAQAPAWPELSGGPAVLGEPRLFVAAVQDEPLIAQPAASATPSASPSATPTRSGDSPTPTPRSAVLSPTPTWTPVVSPGATRTRGPEARPSPTVELPTWDGGLEEWTPGPEALNHG